jgi:FAD/FMN-containing dehydrogenase
VDGLGKVRHISSPEDLKAFRIHLGLLGFVVSVILATTPLYKTTAYNQIFPDSTLSDGTLNQWVRDADQMTVYWFPNQGQVVVANWTIVDVSTPGNAYTQVF